MTVAVNVSPVVSYVGNNTASQFPISFPTFENSNIVAELIKTSTGLTIPLTENTDYTLDNIGVVNQNATLKLRDALVVVGGVTITPSQEWISGGNLKTGYKLYIKFSTEAFQPAVFRGLGQFAPEVFGKVVDRLTMTLKAVKRLTSRALLLSEDQAGTGISLPSFSGNHGKVLTVNATEDGFTFSTGGGGAEGTFAIGDMIEAVDDGTGTPKLVYSHILYDGISALTGQQFTSVGPKDTLDKIIRITYTPPAISLSMSPGQGIREKGDTVSSVTMNTTYTKKSNNIANIKYYRNGVLVNTNSSPTPTGGTDSYVNSTAFSDTISFYASATDVAAGGNGPSTTNSNTVTYSYVYPYYYGVGAQGLTTTQVAALTKQIISNNSNLVETFPSTTDQVYYFAYPFSYGPLTSILDASLFETINDWTARPSANITGLDGTAQAYRIYEFKNKVTTASTPYTFKR